jgi:hypothetical protein
METLLFVSVLECFHYIVCVPSFIGAQTYCQPALLSTLKRIMSRIMRGELGINHQESFVALTIGAKMLSALLNVSVEKSF